MNYKKELCEMSHLLEVKGFVNSLEGNVSIMDRENNLMYVTPSGTRKLTLTEDQVAVINVSTGEQVDGSLKASSEWRLHKLAYDARPDMNGMVHTHCPYMTCFAYANQDIVLKQNLGKLIKGRIKCLPYGEAGTNHIADGIDEALKDSPICLLANHGVVCVAPTLSDAVGYIEGAEEAVKALVYAKLLFGDAGIKDIPGFDDLIARLIPGSTEVKHKED